MTLEHDKDPVSAKWNTAKSAWDIGEKVKYRWVTNDVKPTPKSDWFYDISEALNWIKQYDEKQRSV
jgi:hypothetical protein